MKTLGLPCIFSEFLPMSEFVTWYLRHLENTSSVTYANFVWLHTSLHILKHQYEAAKKLMIVNVGFWKLQFSYESSQFISDNKYYELSLKWQTSFIHFEKMA